MSCMASASGEAMTVFSVRINPFMQGGGFSSLGSGENSFILGGGSASPVKEDSFVLGTQWPQHHQSLPTFQLSGSRPFPVSTLTLTVDTPLKLGVQPAL